jgi:mRNA-degrading endonuclease RelE of RelBE toxin-antitoxin system
MAVYEVQSTPAFERSAKQLTKKHVRIADILDAAREVLEQDPSNLSRTHDIKKLTSVPAGQGQWRIRIGNHRMRYDIDGETVVLRSINDRRDAYR